VAAVVLGGGGGGGDLSFVGTGLGLILACHTSSSFILPFGFLIANKTSLKCAFQNFLPATLTMVNMKTET
jgi:hypothetical protein